MKWATKSARFSIRWLAATGLLVASVLLAVVIAGILLSVDAQRFHPGQQYTWDGWYAAWLFGPYATGLLAVPVLILVWWWRRRSERRRRFEEIRQRLNERGARGV